MATAHKAFIAAKRAGQNGGQDANELNGRPAEYLLRTGARPATVKETKGIARDLGVPYLTVTAYLRRLTSAKKLCHTYVVNPFATPFCNEFRIGIRVDGHQIGARFTPYEVDGNRAQSDRPQPRRGPVKRFIEEIIHLASEERRIAEHLIVTDAAILLGEHDHDVELHVITDDGAYSVRQYVGTVLVAHPCVRATTTVIVGWRYRFDGYSGEYANAKRTAERAIIAPDREKATTVPAIRGSGSTS